MACKKIGIISFKGGVAKTSSAVNIAAGIKNKNPEAKILLVDADPQGSVRSYFQLRLKDKADFAEFLIDGKNPEEGFHQVKTDGGEITGLPINDIGLVKNLGKTLLKEFSQIEKSIYA